jgi:hypothetical protein
VPRYTPTTTFETFPFPFVPGTEDMADPCVKAVAEAARLLHLERAEWLAGGKGRTLTNLYNALGVFRGRESRKSGRTDPAAGDFAPRLAALHDALDAAVCAAYGWPLDTLADDEAILRRLLALNAERAAFKSPPPTPPQSVGEGGIT